MADNPDKSANVFVIHVANAECCYKFHRLVRFFEPLTLEVEFTGQEA
jgi:hypothetical protein